MSGEWQEHQNQADEARLATRQQDRDDLNNEMAGRDTGRMRRFISADENGQIARQKQEKDRFLEFADRMLTLEQQRRYEKLQRDFERYDRATQQALAEVDRDIAQAQLNLEQIQNNATRLDNGRRVYRDENDGQFYDENDQRVNDDEQIEASRNHRDSDSTRSKFKDQREQLENLQKEKSDIIDFDKKQKALEERLEKHPEQADKIEDEFKKMVVPERVHRKALSSEPKMTSAAKEVTSQEGIQSEFSLTPAFYAAGLVGQTPQEPAQRVEPVVSNPSAYVLG